MLSLLLAAIFFAGIHLGVAGTTMRDRAVAALGQNSYRIIFSIASVFGLVWLVMAYNRAPYVVTWGMLEWWKPFAIILMLPTALLVVIGLTTPNPTSVAQEGRLAEAPQGIVRVTRHPFLTGVGLWALVHLIGNGDAASLVFFAVWTGRSFRRDSIDRSKAPASLGQRVGGVCGADLHHSIRGNRRWAKSVQSARNRCMALGPRRDRLSTDARRTRAGDWRLAVSAIKTAQPPA